MKENNTNNVFLSYAFEDLEKARKVYEDLKNRKLNVWLDKEDLKPGPWKPQVEVSL